MKGSCALGLLQLGTFLRLKPLGLLAGPGHLPCPDAGPTAPDGQAGASDRSPLAHLDLKGASEVGTSGSPCCSSPGDRGSPAHRPGIRGPSREVSGRGWGWGSAEQGLHAGGASR